MAITASVNDPEAVVARKIEDIQRQAREDRAAVAATVRPIVSDLADTIQNTLATNYYTKPQTDAKVANPGNINPGNVSASGGVSAGGNVSAAGTCTIVGKLTNAYALANPVSTGYYALYVNGDGAIGRTPSALKYKRDVQDHAFAGSILDVPVRSYRLRSAVESLGDDAPREVGVIAEELEAAGLRELVLYGPEGEPESVSYERLALALIPIVRDLATRVAAIEGAA